MCSCQSSTKCPRCEGRREGVVGWRDRSEANGRCAAFWSWYDDRGHGPWDPGVNAFHRYLRSTDPAWELHVPHLGGGLCSPFRSRDPERTVQVIAATITELEGEWRALCWPSSHRRDGPPNSLKLQVVRWWGTAEPGAILIRREARVDHCCGQHGLAVPLRRAPLAQTLEQLAWVGCRMKVGGGPAL
jgi:hypothetical protein